MKIAVVHLSDIHFVDGNNPILGRAKRIGRAFQTTETEVDVCFVIVTGDIAFSGKSSQYESATAFFSEITEQLQSAHSDLRLEFVFIPGNHDCDLSTDPDVRTVLIDSVSS